MPKAKKNSVVVEHAPEKNTNVDTSTDSSKTILSSAITESADKVKVKLENFVQKKVEENMDVTSKKNTKSIVKEIDDLLDKKVETIVKEQLDKFMESFKNLF